MSRLGPTLGGVAGGGVVCSVIFGSPVVALPFAAVGLLAVALRPSGTRGGGRPDVAWAAPPSAARPDPPLAPPDRGGVTTAQVARALGRVEARELFLSPSYGVGLAFCLAILVIFGGVWAGEDGTPWSETAQLAPWFAHPLVGLVVLALHRAATRPTRDGTAELFGTCPAGPLSRTLGLLSTAWVPVVTLAVFYVAYGVTVGVRSPNHYGTVGADAAADVLGGLLLGAGGVALGVALGRWAAFTLVPVVAVLAVGFASLGLATVGDPGWNPLAPLSTFPPLSDPAEVFTDRPVWSHVVWIAALVVVVAVLALARSSASRAVRVTGGLALAVALVAGIAATRPMPEASARRIASLIAAPASAQTCLPAGPSVDVCAYIGQEELARAVVREIRPVAAALPGTSAAVTLRHAYDGTLDELPGEVTRLLPDGIPELAAGEARLVFQTSRGELRSSRVLVALTALGLRLEARPRDLPIVIAGQARGVVALWVAARGLDAEDAGELLSVELEHPGPEEPDAFDLGNAWPADCEAPVVWSQQDLAAARAVLALPEGQVAAAFTSGWDRWADPRTTTAELLDELNLPGVGRPDTVIAREVGSC